MPLKRARPSFLLIPCVDRFAACLKVLKNHMIGGIEVSPDHELFPPHKSIKYIVLIVETPSLTVNIYLILDAPINSI